MKWCRRNCIANVFTLITTFLVASLYIAVLKHNRDIHKRFHVKRLRVKKDLHLQIHYDKQRAVNMTPIMEPSHPDKYMNSFKGERNDSLHVYIVEDHHEVIPYWFEAVWKEIIPKTGNTLVHIDGHADLAPPLYVPGYPIFISPNQRELKFLMQASDAFIQATAIAGLVNRVIWVWPDWDKTNHDSSYFMTTVSLGYVSYKENSTKRGFCACIKNRTNFECRTLTNVSRLANKSSDDDFIIPGSMCKIKKILIVEEIHEENAAAFFGKRDWIARSENIILDIDEDYYGCGCAIGPLLKANLNHSKLNQLDDLIASDMCPITFTHEQESGKFLMELLSAARTKRACIKHKTLKHSDKCYNIATIDLLQHFRHQLNKAVANDTIRLCFRKTPNDFVQTLLSELLTFSIKQMRLLQNTGFCLRTSLKSFRVNESDYRFGLCIGSNTPKETVVSHYTPTQSEIATRSILLKGEFKELANHSVELVTISRSMRDGCTPREFFEQIEEDILDSLNVSFNRLINVHYDSELLGGKSGWPASHNS